MPKIALMIGKGKAFNKLYGTMCYGIEDHADEAAQDIMNAIRTEGPLLISQSARHIALTPQPLEMIGDNPVMRFRLKFKESKLPKGLFGFIRPATDMRRLVVIGVHFNAEEKFLDLIIGEAKKVVHHKEDEANEDGSDTTNGGMP